MGGILWSTAKKPQQEQQQQGNQIRFASKINVKTQTNHQMSQEDKIILDLKKVKDNLNGRLQKYEQLIQKYQSEAKEYFKAGDKIRSKQCLERKLFFEKSIQQILNQDAVVTKTINQVQEKFNELETTKVLNKANELMKELNKVIDPDAIQDALGNLQELEMNNKQFDQLYEQYVGQNSTEIQDQMQRMEVDIFQESLQKNGPQQQPIISQNSQNQQSINLNKSNSNNLNLGEWEQIQHQPQNNNQQKQKDDEIDDQLAMLA